MSKPKGKLTPIGRKLLVDRITKQGYPVARAAEMQGASRSCAYHWLPRYRTEGEVGLLGYRVRRSTRCLRSHGVNRLDRVDRPTRQAVRYQREHPGELLHVDVKKLGRIPDGGGWRAHGRTKGHTRGRGIGRLSARRGR